jgi:alpha-L-fucosidase 2
MRRRATGLLTAPVLLLAGAVFITLARGAETEPKLHFDRPASKWTEAIPLGNGRLGAMVFGGVQDERYQINESTLWGGGPHDYDNPEAYDHLDEVRKLIFEDKVSEAEQLASTMMGNPKVLMPYQPFCDLHLHFAGDQQSAEYYRDLDLENAIADTAYKIGEVSFSRESFVSFPDQVLVIRLTASKPGQLTLSVGMDSPQSDTKVTSSEDGSLRLTGQIQPRQNKPSTWTGSWDQAETRFAAALKVLVEGGSVHKSGDHLDISGANTVTLLFTNATSFKDYRDISGDPVALAQKYLDKALRKPYAQLRQDHIADYSRLFSRVRLQLGPLQPGNDQSKLPTNERIEQFSKNEDPSLLALYFEFGRYLLISSSRRGGQPANLQGIWNDALLPPWSSKWTTNINLEMNYWQADAGDLWETEDPLWSLIGDLRQTGAETARVHFHSDGWVLHHNTDLWRATTPVDGPWGIWPMGEAWLSNQMWDHYLFSNDRNFLALQAYPAMKAAATFIVGTLVEVPAGMPFAGDLVTNPSTSPENAYLLNGKRESLTYAPAMDLELIRELFENTRKAAQILGKDSAFSDRLEQVQKRLPPLQTGKRGQLQEWIKDYDETELEHRHVSHLYSVYPGHDIDLESTPELAKAADKSLEIRGDGSTGWSQVWRVGLWARLRNSEQAYRNLTLLIDQSTLPNMFDLCGRPFQIDGNLGGPAVMMEMLVQSTNNEIRVLPALPKEWPDGSLTGVRLRGGARADISWKQGRLTSLRLRSDHTAQYRVLYAGQQTQLKLQPGRTVVVDASLQLQRP